MKLFYNTIHIVSKIALPLTFVSALSSCNYSASPHKIITENKGTKPGKENDRGRSGDPEGVSFALLHKNIFATRCKRCHQGSAAPKGLDLSSPEVAYNLLVNKVSSDRPNVLRVSPGENDPSKSYLLAKLISSGEFRKQPRMPLGGNPYLSDEELTAISDWIAEGAKFN